MSKQQEQQQQQNEDFRPNQPRDRTAHLWIHRGEGFYYCLVCQQETREGQPDRNPEAQGRLLHRGLCRSIHLRAPKKWTKHGPAPTPPQSPEGIAYCGYRGEWQLPRPREPIQKKLRRWHYRTLYFMTKDVTQDFTTYVNCPDCLFLHRKNQETNPGRRRKATHPGKR